MSKLEWTKYGDKNAIVEKARRRGARMGVLIALMAAIPGLVAGTSFINGSSGTTLGGTPNIAGEWCGFAESANIEDAAYLGTVTDTGTQIGTGTPAIYTAVTFTPQLLASGSGGYEYLDGEFDIGCSGTPAAGSITLGITLASTVAYTGTTTDSILFVEFPSPGSTVPNAHAPDYKYCTPNAASGAEASAADQLYSSGTCTGTTITDPACAANTYLPNDGDIAATSWFAYTFTTAPAQACASAASFVAGGGAGGQQDVANSIAASAIDWYGAVSLMVYQNGATAVSGSFTLTAITSG